MSTTYTENLNLGMQLDNSEKFNFSLFTENWGKIDDVFLINDNNDEKDVDDE